MKFVYIVFWMVWFEDMICWYREVLEVEIVMFLFFVVFFVYDDEYYWIVIINVFDVLDKLFDVVGMDYCVFMYGSFDDLFIMYECLSVVGIEFYWCVNYGLMLLMYYWDLDGN